MAYNFADSIQKGIIYLLKSDKDFYIQIVNLVKPDFFEFPTHENIFKVITNHYEKYKVLPTDHIILESVKDISEKITVSEYEDELGYINNLDKTSIDNKNYYLDLIEKFARRQAVTKVIIRGFELAKQDRVEEIEQDLRKALSISRDIDLGQNYFFDIKDRWIRSLNVDNSNKFPTVFTRTNDILEGGPARKELAMVVARSGGGKSLYLANQTVQALKNNKKVLYISAEMSEDRVGQRIDSIMTCIPQTKLKEQQDLLHSRLDIFKKEYPDGKLIIKEFPTGRATANTVRALLNQLANYEDFKPDIIIVDYLELLRPTTEGMREDQAQERIAQELRGVAVEYNALMWTATQCNREGAKSAVITDTELGDSYAKIRPTDFSISLNQTDEEYDKGSMRVYVLKSRNGKQRFIFPVNINYQTLIMEDFEGEACEPK